MNRFRCLQWIGAGVLAVVLAISAAGAVAAFAGGLAAHRSAWPGCYPKGSATIDQDKAGRFYHASSGGFDDFYVCAFRHGIPHRLPFSRTSPLVLGPHTATVSGRYLALIVLGDAPRCCGEVVVIDMATGHKTFTGAFNAGTTIGTLGPFPSMPPVLKPDGSVAWIYTAGGSEEVHRHDSTGTAIVDTGPGIDPRSLAAGGSWLYWTKSGSPRSAPFT